MPITNIANLAKVFSKDVPRKQNVSAPNSGVAVMVNKTNTTPKAAGKTADKAKTSPKELAQMLYNQISGPSLNKNTIALLEMITKDNVAEVLIEYKKLSSSKSLTVDIDDEYGLNINTVVEYIGKKLLEQAKHLGVDMDGMKNLNTITNIEDLDDILDILSQKVKTCQNAVKKAENLRANHTLSALKRQYSADKYNIEELHIEGHIVYYVRYKKDNSIAKTVILAGDTRIRVATCENGKVVKLEGICRNETHGRFTMDFVDVYEYDKNGNKTSQVEYQYDHKNGTINQKLIGHTDGKEDQAEIYNNTLSLIYDRKTYSAKGNQIKNQYYTGDNYDISFKGYNGTIINKTKNQTVEIDVARLLDNKYIKENDKIAFLRIIKQLPAEAVADLAVECSLIGNRYNMDNEFNEKEYRAMEKSMSHAFNSAGLSCGAFSAILTRPSVDTIIHELGHLIEWTGQVMDISDGSWKANFDSLFQAENKNYLKYLESQNSIERHYSSENSSEFFAEVYTLMILGNTGHSNDEIITKFFPKSFQMVKNRILEIRKMSPEERNTSITVSQSHQKDEGILQRIKNNIVNYFGDNEKRVNLANNNEFETYKQNVYQLFESAF